MEEDAAPPQAPKELLHCISQPLPEALVGLQTSASVAFPSLEDFHFYSNFPQFKEPLQRIHARVQALLGDISSSKIVPQAPEWPVDDDESRNWLVGMQDEILERVDSALDEFQRERKEKGFSIHDFDAGFQKVTRRRRKVARNVEKDSEVAVASKEKKRVERCPVPFHVQSISRPQDKFDVPVDNSNTSFKHPPGFLRGRKSLGDSEQEFEPTPGALRHSFDNQARKSSHPLEEKLRTMDFVESWLIDAVEPKQPVAMSETPFTMVDSPVALKDMAAKLLCEREIAVDLENHQYRSFQGFTCLMQLSTRLEDFIVDVLGLRSYMGPYLGDIFANPKIQKVMHGADSDIVWLQRDFGIYVCNLFDTGQASRVLEMESHGLAYLLENFCQVQPDKRYQLADWRIRPLSTEMLKYAREDTHYLLYIHDLLKQKLIAAQQDGPEAHDPLLEVYKRSRDVCLQLYEKELLTEKSHLHVYGLHEKQFQAEQVAVLAGLYAWRDKIARMEDESTGYVLPNHLLLKLAEEMPENVSKLHAILNARHILVARNAATVVEIIRQSRQQALVAKQATFDPVFVMEEQNCVLPSSSGETVNNSVSKKPPGGLASMLAPRGRQSLGRKAPSVEDAAQAEARFKVDRIKASVVLPFHAFSGDDCKPTLAKARNDLDTELMWEAKGQEHSNCKRDEMEEEHSRISTEVVDKSLSEYEEVIPLEAADSGSDMDNGRGKVTEEVISIEAADSGPDMDNGRGEVTEEVISIEAADSGPDMDNGSGKVADNMKAGRSKGIITSAAGSQHRGWWPCLVNTVDTGEKETTSTGEMQFPLSISEIHRGAHRQRRERQSPVSSRGSKRDSFVKVQNFSNKSRRSGSRRDQAWSAQKEEIHGLKPFDYGAAKKLMESETSLSCKGLFDRRDQDTNKGKMFKKGKNSKVSHSNEIAFDPLRRFREEFIPDEGQRRRQVFPQSGNRTGIFK